MGATCLVIGDICIKTIINDWVIGNTGNDMRIQYGIIRQTCGERYWLEKLIEGDEGLNVGVDVNTSVFQKDTESPEI